MSGVDPASAPERRPEDFASYGGFVYFVREGSAGYWKIGQSRDPWARVRDIQTASPRPLVLRYIVAAGLQDPRLDNFRQGTGAIAFPRRASAPEAPGTVPRSRRSCLVPPLG